MSEDSRLIGVDWGTTRLRAFRIGADGQILERRSSDRGVGVISDGRFDVAFEAILEGWPSGVPVLMCGMVGSRQGWRETPYQPCPAHVTDLVNSLSPLGTRYGPAWIVGGVRSESRAAADQRCVLHDVMRGEETQIFGVSAGCENGLIITPGTHSKWATVREERIESFRTYMTGELYALLEQHSILGRLMESGAQYHEASFLDGVHVGFAEPTLLHSLFSVRTQGLFSQRAPAMLASYMSGILIGSEVSFEARLRDLSSPVTVIASEEMGRQYQAALSVTGWSDLRFVDAEAAVVQGLQRIWRLRGRCA
jgi:2-dehydro-3-deoxygalactonokinase